MSYCSGIGLSLVALLSQQFIATHTAIAGESAYQGENSGIEAGVNKSLPKGAQINSAIREAIFRNRQQLLEFLGAPTTNSVVCTPGQSDSYELFQASLREELDALWDLDIYASKYGL